MSLRALLSDPPWLCSPSLPDAFPGAESIATPLATLPVPTNWRPHERERLLGLARDVPIAARKEWGLSADAIAERAKAMTEDGERLSLHHLLGLGEHDAARLFNELPPRAFLAEPASHEALVARLGARAAPGLVARGQDIGLRPSVFRMLLRIGTPLAAPVLLDAFLRLRSLRGTSKRCFLRFTDPMLDALVPLAAGTPAANLGLVPIQKSADLVRAARLALHYVNGAGEGDAIAHTAKRLGLAAAWKDIAAEDPMTGMKPAPIPPKYLVCEHPRSLDGKALRDGDWETFLTWLSLLDWDTPRLVPILDPGSLHAPMKSLLDAWLSVGALKAHLWVIHSVVEFGGHETVRALHAALRKWKAAYQTPGSDVLDAVGTVATRHLSDAVGEAALELLADLSIKGSSKSQEVAARSVIQAIDAELEGEGDLDDRLVPRLGLDDRGRAKLDYGNRAFAIRLGTTLELHIEDTGGARLPKLPAAKKMDDAAKAKEARARMAALGRQARVLVSRLVDRMQTALRSQKRWNAPVFELLVVRHPVVGSLARGIVWAAFADERLVTTFRISEDRTFADVDDKRFELAIGHTVRVAHPATVDAGTWAAWSRVLGDYEIIQPFAQLGWPVVRLEKAELDQTVLARFEGATFSRDVLAGKGFHQGPWRPDVQASCTFEALLRNGIRAMIFHAPSTQPWIRSITADKLRIQRLEELGWESFLPFSALDPVSASEMLHGLETVRA
jgi:hypothetical protein